MYLKRLYRQSKFWFWIIILFAASQLFLNYKNGVELSPFYHYGMFSLPFHLSSVYECVEVKVNGKELQTKNFTPNGWDNIVIPIVQYHHQSKWNSEMYNQTIKRLMPVADSIPYTYQLSQSTFDEWYRQRMLRMLKIKDTSASIQYNVVSYQQQNGRLVK